jgi:hypothetical protein
LKKIFQYPQRDLKTSKIPLVFLLEQKKSSPSSQESDGIENGIPFHKINELEIRLMIMGFGMSWKNIHSRSSQKNSFFPQLRITFYNRIV